MNFNRLVISQNPLRNLGNKNSPAKTKQKAPKRMQRRSKHQETVLCKSQDHGIFRRKLPVIDSSSDDSSIVESVPSPAPQPHRVAVAAVKPGRNTSDSEVLQISSDPESDGSLAQFVASGPTPKPAPDSETDSDSNSDSEVEMEGPTQQPQHRLPADETASVASDCGSTSTSSYSDDSSDEIPPPRMLHRLVHPRNPMPPRRASKRLVDLNAAARGRLDDRVRSRRFVRQYKPKDDDDLRGNLSSDASSVRTQRNGVMKDTEQPFRRRVLYGEDKKDGATIDATPLSGPTGVTLADVVGYDDLKGRLEDIVSGILDPVGTGLFPGVRQARGMLLHGPPGNGKTFIARALAGTLAERTGTPVAFFMRKGADCLSKWVGEAERQLRHLFETARSMAPAIILFDELDGLAPVRSSRQDQIHASVVTTLLALLDGFSDRGDVVVIGTTNRPDCIDPALRRPGRLDIDLYVGPPSEEVRMNMVVTKTLAWPANSIPSTNMAAYIARMTAGFSGADVAALVGDAVVLARRRAGLVGLASDRTSEETSAAATRVRVSQADWVRALSRARPTDRGALGPATPAWVEAFAAPIAKPLLDRITTLLPEASGGTSPQFWHPHLKVRATGMTQADVDVAMGAVTIATGQCPVVPLHKITLSAIRPKPEDAHLTPEDRLGTLVRSFMQSAGIMLLHPSLGDLLDDVPALIDEYPAPMLIVTVEAPDAEGPALDLAPHVTPLRAAFQTIIAPALLMMRAPAPKPATQRTAPTQPKEATRSVDEQRTMEKLRWALGDLLHQAKQDEAAGYNMRPFESHADVNPDDPNPPFPTLEWVFAKIQRLGYTHPDEFFDDLGRLVNAAAEGLFGTQKKASALQRKVHAQQIVNLACRRAGDIHPSTILACNIMRERKRAAEALRATQEEARQTMDEVAVEEPEASGLMSEEEVDALVARLAAAAESAFHQRARPEQQAALHTMVAAGRGLFEHVTVAASVAADGLVERVEAACSSGDWVLR
ncbi:ATPase family associated with various cellular activities (AAA) [Carpediemonas membranifera]|uniref:ATPase family associated with various cellular activities (AAA) n=1 Tax=Carpediemonas membranifera TaxID=201153 RepID=A0A8J6BCY9_9EUKA|nr:ATPase family associated with various cellular activities (AAA) [Carpediemonas membranifera]|eukprot:KAG9394872.1 ATPase family associated with various cellular activities (AAA) [Carpediemonas membranifera]